jgi:hypothetical protein
MILKVMLKGCKIRTGDCRVLIYTEMSLNISSDEPCPDGSLMVAAVPLNGVPTIVTNISGFKRC